MVVVEYRDPKYGRVFSELVASDRDTILVRPMGGGLAWTYPASTVIRVITIEEYLRIVPEHGRSVANR